MRRRLPSSTWIDTTIPFGPTVNYRSPNEGMPPWGSCSRRRPSGRGPTLLVLKLLSISLLKSTNPHFATMVHRGTAGIPPALRAGSYRYRLQERSGQSRVGHGITLPVAARAIQPLCGQHLSVTTSCGRSCPTAPGGCLPHVGRPVAAYAATGCPAPIEWLVDSAS